MRVDRQAGLVTLATFVSPEEAELVRAVLEAKGVRAFVDGGHVVGMAWHYGNAVGGVKLLVGRADAERAIEVLRSARQDATADAATNEPDDDGAPDAAAEAASAEDDPAAVTVDGRPPDADAKQVVDRAWRAAVFGLV